MSPDPTFPPLDPTVPGVLPSPGPVVPTPGEIEAELKTPDIQLTLLPSKLIQVEYDFKEISCEINVSGLGT